MTTVAAAAAQTAAAQSGAQRGATGLANTFDAFLTLLTAQLQFQDPLDPVDSNQWTQQLVSFSGVEQQIATNANLERLTELSSFSAGATAAGYLGKTAEAASNAAGLVDGKAEWTVTLPRAAQAASYEILDSQGRTVRRLTGATAAGPNTVTWDGKTGTGADAAQGVYTLQVSAKGADNANITATVTTKGTVTGVDFSTGDVVLTVAGAPVNLARILRLTQETSQ
jgi:flagellar basal-body rod modification protein FlgD